jgi:hypothetical protein
MTVSTRFVQLSTIHGSPAAAARALKFPINSFVRVSSGLPVRAGTLELAKRCLADYDALAVTSVTQPLALSSMPLLMA